MFGNKWLECKRDAATLTCEGVNDDAGAFGVVTTTDIAGA